MRKALIICGATGSGKTEFAHYIAQKYQGEIVNADSMQVYSQIPLITASPPLQLKSCLPYHLYNFLDIQQQFSVTKYVNLATEKIKNISANNLLPVIVGGTGMYINALIYGYSSIPEISSSIREQVKQLHAQVGQQQFFKYLQSIDPAAASKLHTADQQRSLRAYEVFKQTGRSILSFQTDKQILPLREFKITVALLEPERNFLYNNCNERAKIIFNEQGIEEIKSIQNNLKPDSSARQAIGITEISHYLNNKISLNEAINLIQARTRHYAKRQNTWFKNQLSDKIVLPYSSVQEYKKLTQTFTFS